LFKGIKQHLYTVLRIGIFAGIVLLIPSSVLAAPQGGTVVSGDISINKSGTYTEIKQNTQKGIVDWQSFNIAKNEHTHFQQPNSSSMTLNRVVGSDPSHILGRLTATGQIMLINRAGILFGKNAQVDVAGMIATTADISNRDFNSDIFHFVQPDGFDTSSVINRGTITAADSGLVALLAPGVENSGLIRANLGNVVLASGKEFTVDLAGDNLIRFAVNSGVTENALDENGNPLDSVIKNSGRIVANGGRVILTARAARGIVDNVINMSGTIEANTLKQRSGEIILDGGNDGIVHVAGRMLARGNAVGESGGSIRVLGGQVGLFDEALLDTSGNAGGGEVLVGGDYQGKNAAVRNAKTTFVGSNVKIKANAEVQGDGGKVVVWADDSTEFKGSIEAKGGPQGGNGGLAEVSGKQNLTFQGRVDLSAPLGVAGSLLLDPENLTIISARGTNLLHVDDLIAALENADVTIQTSAEGSEAGNVTFADSVIWGSDNSLVLRAHNDINIDSGAIIKNTGAGNLQLIAAASPGSTGMVKFLNNGTIDFSGSSGDVSLITTPINPTTGQVDFTYKRSYDGLVSMGSGAFSNDTAINSSAALHNIRNNLAGGYALTTNIDVTDIANFTPVGTASTPFTGTFNGAGYTISNLTIDKSSTNNVGLFGYTGSGSAIENVTLSNLNVTGSAYTGGVVGFNNATMDNVTASGNVTCTGNYCGGLAGTNTATATDVTFSGTVDGGNYNYIGGLYGETSGAGSITRGSVTGATSTVSGLSYVGGLVGSIKTTGGVDITVDDSYSFASVTGQNNYIGGLAGILDGNALVASANIENSYSIGNVISTGSTGQGIGGFVGLIAAAAGSITNSYSTGSVDLTGSSTLGIEDVGGFVGGVGIGSIGQTPNTISNSYSTGGVNAGDAVSVGGFIGLLLNYNTVTNAYSTGFVSGGSNVGGFIGKRNTSGITVTSSFWDTTTSGTVTGVGSGSATGITGKTTTQMQTQGTFAGWDFTNDWGIVAATSYPYLQWRFTTAPMVITSTSNLGANKKVNVIKDADIVATTSTGNNGYYNLLVDSPTEDTAYLVYTKGDSIYRNLLLAVESGHTSATLDYFNTNNLLLMNNSGAASGFLTNTVLSDTIGSLGATDDYILYSASGNDITYKAGRSLQSIQAFTLNGNITAAGSGNIDFDAAVTLGADVTINTSAGNGNVNFDDTINGGQALTLNSGSGMVTLSDNVGATTALSGLSITQAGAMSYDTPEFHVTGTTTLAAGAAKNITLANAANEFGTVAITSGKDVTLRDVGPLALGASTVSGALNVTTGGDLTQSGALAVTDTATLAAGAGNDITLSNAANNFSTVAITSGSDVTLVDSGALALGASTVSGALNVTTGDALTQSGALAVTDTATLAAGADNDITLSNAANNFSTVVITSGNNVTLRDVGPLALGASTVSGALNVTTGGDLTQSGALAVTDTATLAAGAGNDITLSNAANNFSTVAITSGSDVTLVDSGALALGASTVSGALNVTTGGALTQSGAVAVTNTATIVVGAANDITLSNAANDFSTVVITSGNDVTLRDVGALALGTSTVSGALNVTTGGALTQSGALAVTDTTTLAAGATNDITLNNAANEFSTVAITSGQGVTLRDVGALILGTSTVSGALNVTTGGALTQSGAVAVTGGTTTLVAGSNDITLNNSSNDFSTVSLTSGGDITLVDTNALTLQTPATYGSLNVTASSGITLPNDVTTTGSQTYNSAVTLGGAGTRTLTTSSNGDVEVGGALTGGSHNLTISTGSGNITLAALSGVGALALNSTSTTTLGGAVTSTTSLTTNTGGTTVVNADVTTTGAQIYNDAITLGGAGDRTFTATGGSITFASTIGGTAGSTVPGLVLSADGDISLGGDLGTLSLPLNSVSIDESGVLNLGVNVYTSEEQTYSDQVLLTDDVTLASGSTVTFSHASTLNSNTGNESLTIDEISGAGGDAVFSGDVGTGTALEALSVAGTSELAGNVKTTGNQTYTGAATILPDGTTTLTSTGGTVAFGSILDGTGATTDLEIVGNASFGGNVGDITALTSLDISGNTTYQGNDFSITTTGDQTYGDNVADALTVDQGAAVTLNATSAGNITFSGKIYGATGGGGDLTINTSGEVTLNGEVGGDSKPLGSLAINGDNTLNIGYDITTTGNQTYNDIITFTSASAQALTSSSGTITFNDPATKAVGALTISGNAALNGNNITATTGLLTFSDGAVTLGGDLTLTGAGITLGSTFNGANTLTLAPGANALTITGDMGNTTKLTNVNFGNNYTQLNLGGMITADTITQDLINKNIVLVGNGGFNTSSTNTGFTFGNTVSGSYTLTLAAGTGDITFNSNSTMGTAGSRLGGITISGVGAMSNETTLYVQNYSQGGSGGTADFSAGSGSANRLDASADASVTAPNVIGDVKIGGRMYLGGALANITGTVSGSAGTYGASNIQLLNRITERTHFFNGIDLFAFYTRHAYVIPLYLIEDRPPFFDNLPEQATKHTCMGVHAFDPECLGIRIFDSKDEPTAEQLEPSWALASNR
jgi:trimeric autotransporter adhesin